ncbi:hypothetical protein BsWGS_04023 [Bradybaena similaris]
MQAVPARVSQIYYTYGLFCASHPFVTIISVIITVLITCYPLTNMPLPGNTPIEHRTLKSDYTVLDWSHAASASDGPVDDQKRPRWFVGEPVAYVQQIVLKSAVSPWQPQHLKVSDAFRAPLLSVFNILQQLDTFKVTVQGQEVSLADICYRVSEPVNTQHLQHLLPDYSCFIVSPANFWQQDVSKFIKDPDIINTIYKKYGQVVESPPTTKDLLFGIPWKETGLTRYYIRNRQRVITCAVTIVMKKYHPNFVSGLRDMLEQWHTDTAGSVNNSQVEDLVHVHFKDINYVVEYTPLMVTYLALSLYLYFSVRKIEMVKSKIGLAISAVMTVLASLMMSVSICTVFGMRPTLNRGEIFPYLMIIVGVENVLVITKSVVSTPVHLDVKIRVAQGLSREGWSITKNLLSELAIVFIGFFTFVPAIQEFCAFALVGVLSDFYLQIAFFATVLSLDIRRMELSDLHRQSVQQVVQEDMSNTYVNIQPLILCPVAQQNSRSPVWSPSAEVNPSPRVVSPDQTEPRDSPPCPGRSSQSVSGQHRPAERARYEMPRRLKFFYFLARFRIVQKLIMVCTVIWIMLILYKAGLVDRLTGEEHSHATPRPSFPSLPGLESTLNRIGPTEDVGNLTVVGRLEEEQRSALIKHTDLELWRQLSHKHWPVLFHSFNISLSGRYISFVPTIHLSELIDPQTAIRLRSTSGELSQSLTHLDPEDSDTGDNDSQDNVHQFENFYPRSQKEYIITVLLCFLSVIVLTYFMSVLYRCMCSRNYSRWRHSWHRSTRRRSKGYLKQIKESVPLVLSGHTQNIECLLGDNGLVVSCCLGGHLKIWNSNSGECINTIMRNRETPACHRRPCVLGRNVEDSDADLYAEYHGEMDGRSSSETSLLEDGGEDDGVRIRKGNFLSTDTSGRGKRMGRSRQSRYQDLMPDLVSTINTEFSSMCCQVPASGAPTGYNFRSWFEGVYEEHRRFMEDDHQTQQQTVQPSGDRSRSCSFGDHWMLDVSTTDEDLAYAQAASVWCLATLHGLIVTGCGNGHIEIWEAETGELRYHYGVSEVGITGLCVVANKIVAARLDGSLDFLDMETFHNPAQSPYSVSSHSLHSHRGHAHSYSTGIGQSLQVWNEVIRCAGVTTCRAHQLPINAIQCAGGRVVTASQDHTLKVFRLENSLCLYTMHGHEAAVTALCLDQITPFAAVSGSVDGTVRMWDLITGTCVHVFDWHGAAVATLTISPLYIVSVGLDDHMCVWDRLKSVLLHTVHLEQAGVGSAALMSRNLVVTGGQGSISLWDVQRGSLLRKVVFADGEQSAYVNHIVSVANNGIVCDQGQDLKIVFFPTILEKAE